jgi:hypothetical protein
MEYLKPVIGSKKPLGYPLMPLPKSQSRLIGVQNVKGHPAPQQLTMVFPNKKKTCFLEPKHMTIHVCMFL